MLPKRDEVLAEMEDYATEHNVPIVGPAVARVLQQLALMINARTVFELGSAIGYSTIWWAQAVGDKGRVIYTDGDSKNAERARGYFKRAGVSNRITLHTGDALEFLSEQKQEFDIIFNDVDKEDYPRVLRLVAPRLRKGGLFITDNVLWSGRVAEKNPTEATDQGHPRIQSQTLRRERVLHDAAAHPRWTGRRSSRNSAGILPAVARASRPRTGG